MELEFKDDALEAIAELGAAPRHRGSRPAGHPRGGPERGHVRAAQSRSRVQVRDRPSGRPGERRAHAGAAQGLDRPARPRRAVSCPDRLGALIGGAVGALVAVAQTVRAEDDPPQVVAIHAARGAAQGAVVGAVVGGSLDRTSASKATGVAAYARSPRTPGPVRSRPRARLRGDEAEGRARLRGDTAEGGACGGGRPPRRRAGRRSGPGVGRGRPPPHRLRR